MKIKSVNIVGITGGIGNALYDTIKCLPITIHGCYFSNELVSKELAKNENVTLQRIDLTRQNSIEELCLPNYEAIVYLAGIPHFSNDIFQFNSFELTNQININLYSLLACIKGSLSHEDSALKKIIIVSSTNSNKFKSIYNLFKHLQEDMIKKLEPMFSQRNISVSIIKTDWVETNMYKKFLALNKNCDNGQFVLKPKEIADICINELENFKPFNILDIINKEHNEIR